MKYPVRINKYLADKNVSSRREADDLISRGQIKINGKRAVLGDKVQEGDKVEISKNVRKNFLYYVFNKPVGIVTHSPQRDEKGILDTVKFPAGVFPIGRLDKDSWGLILLTNDGRITGKVLDPERHHEKEYYVTVNRPLTESFLRKMGRGVKLDDGYRTRIAKVQKINDHLFSIVLTEGKKRQIRRMCAALGFSVMDLKRVRIMNLTLKRVKPGEFYELKGAALEKFKTSLGLE